MTKIQETGDKVLANVERVIVGKHHEAPRLVALLCRGHLLKTSRHRQDGPGQGDRPSPAARSAGSVHPDLLPSDVSGLSIYNQNAEFESGRPDRGQVVLADEINRRHETSRALGAWRSGRRRSTGHHPMPDPFPVIATQTRSNTRARSLPRRSLTGS
jgi:MoxR-like ATPase